MMLHYNFHPSVNAVVEGLLPCATSAPARRLYLSRARHDGWHALANESEVEVVLTDLGFTVLHPQELDLPTQLAHYAAATCIVAQYSSAAHNALFAPFGTPVCCFGWMNRCQSGIAALRGQPVAYLKPSNCDLIYPPAHRDPGVFRLQVDCQALARDLPAFLRFTEAQRHP
jgi:capsular polysaccharide biosynthesis protein